MSYTDESEDDDQAVIQDRGRNYAHSFSNQNVVNKAPIPEIASITTGIVEDDGNTLDRNGKGLPIPSQSCAASPGAM